MKPFNFAVIKALLGPFENVAALLALRRGFLLVGLAMFCAGTWATAVSMRIDRRFETLSKLSMNPDFQAMSESDVRSAVEMNDRKFIVSSVAFAVVGVPAIAILFAVALRIFAWILAHKLTFRDAFQIAAIALLPFAVKWSIAAFLAVFHSSLTFSEVENLVPSALSDHVTSSTPLLKLVDLFWLWSLVLIATAYAHLALRKRIFTYGTFAASYAALGSAAVLTMNRASL